MQDAAFGSHRLTRLTRRRCAFVLFGMLGTAIGRDDNKWEEDQREEDYSENDSP